MKKSISLLIFIDSIGCGGAEKSLISLLPFLVERNYNITLMVMSRGGLFECYLPSNVRIIEFPFKPSRFRRIMYSSITIRMPWNRKRHKSEIYWKFIGRYYPAFKEHFDVAIAYQQGFPTYYIAEKVTASRKYSWVNIDLKAVGYSPNFCYNFYEKFNKIVAVSSGLAQNLIYPDYCNDRNKIIVCRDIVNESLIRQMSLKFNPFIDDGAIKIVTVGRLVNQKGYDLAIEAASY